MFLWHKLRSGVDWLLENRLSTRVEQPRQTAARSQRRHAGRFYIPATSTYGGYQAYRPLPHRRALLRDPGQKRYNITLPGGVAPEHQLDRQLRDTLEQIERDKRARQRASMTHDF